MVHKFLENAPQIASDIDDIIKETRENFRGVKQASGGYIWAHDTAGASVGIDACNFWSGTSKVSYSGTSTIGFYNNGALETEALTASWYNKLLVALDDAGGVTRFEGTEAATLGAVADPIIRGGLGNFYPLAMINVQDDGDGAAGTLSGITNGSITQMQGYGSLVTNISGTTLSGCTISGNLTGTGNFLSTISGTTLSGCTPSGEWVNRTLPAFLTTPPVGPNQIPINGKETIVFSVEIFDQGNNYSGSTFTAPVTGKYSLSVQINFQTVDSAATGLTLYINTSNRDYSAEIAPDQLLAGDDEHTIGFTVLADMNINDFARVQVYQTGGAQQTYPTWGTSTLSSYFSGYLVC